MLRLTTAAICGSDLHMYEGRTPTEPGTIFGHENLGVIEQVCPAVKSIKAGDRVVLPFNIGCGFCFNNDLVVPIYVRGRRHGALRFGYHVDVL